MKYWPTKPLALLTFVLFLTSISCKKKENNLGIAIQPQDEELSIGVSDTTKLITYIEQGDSIRTDELSGDNLLGSYVDPYFGKIEASIYSQLRLSTAVDFTPLSGNLTDLVIDSVRLYLKISDFYGNTQPQDFHVYQLTDAINIDSNYYSTRSIATSSLDLVSTGFNTIKPAPYTLGSVAGQVVDQPILTIPLDITNFGWNIFNQSTTGVLAGNDGAGKFNEWFKGILITTNTVQNTNQGGLIYADLLNKYSKVTIFYRDTVLSDTMAFSLNFNAQTARFHRIKMNYTGSYVGNVLSDSTIGQQQFFTQTLGGVNGKIAFPHLEEYIKDGKVVVNKAELILPAQYYALDKYLPASQLFLTRKNVLGKEVFIDDFSEDFGGTYNFSTNEYVINVTRHINQVFSGNIPNTPLTILTNKSGISANRVVFNGAETTLRDKPKLKLTFTKY